MVITEDNDWMSVIKSVSVLYSVSVTRIRIEFHKLQDDPNLPDPIDLLSRIELSDIMDRISMEEGACACVCV